jgi:hypothetical protein
MKLLFSRAANLIREAFEVDGGCIFYDAQTGFGSDKAHSQGPHEDPRSLQESATSSIAGCLSSDMDSSVSAGGYFSDAESKRKFPAALPALPSQGDGSLEFGDTAFSSRFLDSICSFHQ